MLGPAPIRGDVKNYPEETPLNMAVKDLNSVILNGKFVVMIDKTSLSTVSRKEMFYLTTHSTHFIYGYMASDIW